MQGNKVMVIAAHPDDETYCSGTLAKLADDGNHIVLVIATSGNRGTMNPEVLPGVLARTRQLEMDDAAKIITPSTWTKALPAIARRKSIYSNQKSRTVKSTCPRF